MAKRPRGKAKSGYDDLLSSSQKQPRKRLRRPNRKSTYPKTIKIHLRNPNDGNALARLLQTPLKVDAVSRRLLFMGRIDLKSDSVINLGNKRPSTWKLDEEGLKKYTPRKNRTWNTDWFFRSHWTNMVPFEQEREAAWLTYQITFPKPSNYAAFARLIKEPLTEQTSSIWFPRKEPTDYRTHWWISRDGKRNQPRYPIFIVSKGRAHEQLTMRSLSDMGLKYYVMVEPQELELYLRLSPKLSDAKYLSLETGNHGQGPGLARNACWDFAKDNLKATRFFVLDDNIDGFYRLHQNKRYRCGDGTPFRVLEDFVDRYENVPLAGFQYRFFKAPDHKHYPFTVNTRIYSAALVSTSDERFRQRGRYNEDTIQSIDVMKAGFATVEFTCFLSGKLATQVKSGGNTTEFYDPQGKKNRANATREKSQLLVDTHPDVCKLKFQYGRWHHVCDYQQFRHIQLKRTAGWIARLKNDLRTVNADAYKMKLVPIK